MLSNTDLSFLLNINYSELVSQQDPVRVERRMNRRLQTERIGLSNDGALGA